MPLTNSVKSYSTEFVIEHVLINLSILNINNYHSESALHYLSQFPVEGVEINNA